MIIYEIMRQIATDEKAIMILSRYGISKWLAGIEKHKDQPELRKLIEDLALKLVKTGHRQLSVTVLFKMATSQEIVSIHPRL